MTMTDIKQQSNHRVSWSELTPKTKVCLSANKVMAIIFLGIINGSYYANLLDRVNFGLKTKPFGLGKCSLSHGECDGPYVAKFYESRYELITHLPHSTNFTL